MQVLYNLLRDPWRDQGPCLGLKDPYTEILDVKGV